jgi:hypothetical protein
MRGRDMYISFTVPEDVVCPVVEAKNAFKSIREPSVVLLCPGAEAKHAVKIIREPSVVACPGVEAKR